MARKLRVQYEGAIYHVTVRGVERRRIFRDDRDRERFLMCLEDGVKEHGIRVYLYCLMTNHAHLLVETPKANLSAFMHKVQTGYAVYHNLRHRRAGHLMQGRFGAEPVQGDDYLLRLSRYIHLNPVFVEGMKDKPLGVRREYLRGYPWSSYRGYAGFAKPREFMDEAPVLAMIESRRRKQRRAYRHFVETGIAREDEELTQLMTGSRWGVGDGDFQAWIRDMHTELIQGVEKKEDISFRREEPRVEADTVLRAVAEAFTIEVAALRKRRYACVARPVAALLLGRLAGMNQRDIGAFLGIGTGAAVCQQLKHLRERMEHDPHLAKRINEIMLAAKAGKSRSKA
jgi:REP element-mobilizing transposase RayT